MSGPKPERDSNGTLSMSKIRNLNQHIGTVRKRRATHRLKKQDPTKQDSRDDRGKIGAYHYTNIKAEKQLHYVNRRKIMK